MTRVNLITLIAEAVTTDSIGQMVTTETTTDVIAEIKSVSRSEFMSGAQNGLTPSFVFIVSMFAYTGQKIVKYNNSRYRIYRTYETDDNVVELYAEAEVGVSYG